MINFPTLSLKLRRSLNFIHKVDILSLFFYGCANLTSVKFHSKIREIQERVFFNCNSLDTLIIPDGVESLDIKEYCCFGCIFPLLKFRSKINSISTQAFANCKNLKEIILESIPANIASGIFYNCTNIIKITLNNDKIDINLVNKMIDDVRSNINEIIVNISSIPPCLFANFVKLEKALLKSNKISDSMFENCSSLRNVSLLLPTLPEKFDVGKRGFYNCLNLDVTILKRVRSIDDYGFYGCPFPRSIVIPKDILSISQYAFSNTRIEYVNFCSNQFICYSNSFDNKVKAYVTDSFANSPLCSLPTTRIDRSVCHIPHPTSQDVMYIVKMRT